MDMLDHKNIQTYFVKQILNIWREKLKGKDGVLDAECGWKCSECSIDSRQGLVLQLKDFNDDKIPHL
jgi:hypothetical protein